MKNFDGKTALITGGSSGIGLELGKQLAAEGMHIWILARNPEKLETACKEISAARKSPTQQVEIIAADVADFEQLSSVLVPFLHAHGTPDLLVNNAGVTYPGEFDTLNLEIFHQMMDINYYGTVHMCKLIVPGMKARRSGEILNISSFVARHGLYGYTAYAASKFAQRGLSEVLFYELSPYNIHVSTAYPTDTDTPQLAFENQMKPPVLKALSEGNTTVVAPDVVARNIIRGLKKGKTILFPTSDGNLLYYLIYGLFRGDSTYWLVNRLLMKQAFKKAAKDNGAH